MPRPPPSTASSVLSDESGEEGSDNPKEPLVFENPDGSLHHALPSGTRYKRPAPETPPGDRLGRDWIFWDPELMRQIERIYAHHERAFIILIFLQFLLENGFNVLLIKHRGGTIDEIQRAYPFMTEENAMIVFWVLTGIGITFAAIYYILAGLCIYERRSIYMKYFSDASMVGIIGQVIFAYINRFNLVLFFLRFVIFSYSRFLLSILNGTARIVMTRRTTDQQQAAAIDNENVLIEV